jgi:Flp pilus assembly CpaE family ATPase
MPILCGPSESTGRLLYSIGGDVHAVDSLIEAAWILDRDPREVLVVIGPRAPVGEALAFAARLRMSRPAVGVILTRHEADVALLTQALQAGIREVVRAGDDAALADACRRSYEVSRRMVADTPVQQAERRGQVVTVFAAKGGCGKTTLATNLGVVLANGTGQHVCIVDLDLAFGDVAISMQLDPARTVVDALPMAGHLDSAGAASLLTSYQPGLEILLAPVTPGDAEKITPALVGELLTVLRGIFDYVVVDTPAQFSEHVLIAMDSSDHHVLLTTPDVPALKNLRVTLDMLDLLSYPRDIRSIVVNRADSKVGLSLEHVEHVVRCPISARVPSSRAVPISINKGTPIVLDSPAHPVSQAITRFAQQRMLPAGAPAKRVPVPRRTRRSA